jgi:hypothetical protein
LRLRRSPTDADVTAGNALNVLARELTGPEFGLSTLRYVPVKVPTGVLELLPLHLSRAGIVIAPDRLRVEGRWPARLQDATFAPARRAYEQAIATVFHQAAQEELTADCIEAFDRAAIGLRRQVEAAALASPSGEWGSARAFLVRLDRAARALHDPAGAAAFSAVLGQKVATVAGLLELMRRHHLQFGPAQTLDEEERYRDLLARLVEQRSRLTGQDDGIRLGARAPEPRRGPAVAMVADEVREEGERH